MLLFRDKCARQSLTTAFKQNPALKQNSNFGCDSEQGESFFLCVSLPASMVILTLSQAAASLKMSHSVLLCLDTGLPVSQDTPG